LLKYRAFARANFKRSSAAVAIYTYIGNAHVHTGGAIPKTEIEIDLEIAKQVAAATAGFDSFEIARLKLLVAGADAQSFS
jgi:hypothetical protein